MRCVSPFRVSTLDIVLLEDKCVVDEGEGEDGAHGRPGLREGPVVKQAGLAPPTAPAGDADLNS